MEKTNFIDYIRIFCHSGHGGAGSKHYMRTKYNAMAGPDGGDGGRGAHIILRGSSQLWALLHLRYFKNVLAEDGECGNKNNQSGRSGKDIIIEVPLGTIAKDELTGAKEAEILEEGQEIIWVKGGRGGLGNSNFKTATNQAPDYAQPGEEGTEGWKILELKVLADVGLVGFPNAGKSTLLSCITAAKPKIADYAFTTLIPQLGMVEYRDGKSFCIADLPGIIEGAAEGKGLGHRFLRHIERNSILLFLIPADSTDHKKEFEILVKELEDYNPEMLQKDFVIAISKADMLDEELKMAIQKELPTKDSAYFYFIHNRAGITQIKRPALECNEPTTAKIKEGLKTVFKYVEAFYRKEFRMPYFLMVLCMLGTIIYLNYWHGLEKNYIACGTTWLENFTGYYLLYFIPFALAFFLQLLFFNDCGYYKNIWFWVILLLAPAFFSFRVNFNFHESWVKKKWEGEEQVFYLHSINWVIRVFVVLLPVYLTWLIKDRATQPFYGFKALDGWRPYGIMLLVMVPLIALASTQSDFLEVYPKAKMLDNISITSWMDKWRYLVFEFSYGFDFVSIEFFFRGFLILALARICGMHCIIPVACFYCTIHLGKPMGEAISSFFGGTLLSIIAFNTGSIWGGLIVHLGVAWLMELGGWLGMLYIKFN